MKIGVNTFGIGKLLREDFSGTLKELREAGITTIEPWCCLWERRADWRSASPPTRCPESIRRRASGLWHRRGDV